MTSGSERTSRTVLPEADPFDQTAALPQDDGHADDREYQEKIDRQVLIGSVLIGTWVLAIPGIFILRRAYRLYRAGKLEGRFLTPGAVTLVALLCLVDGWLNYVPWGADLFFAHDTAAVRTVLTSLGRLWDGAYYLGYNSTAAGGTPIASEKGLEIAGVLVLYPMRIAAAYGFLKMRRWGLNYMLITSWMYTFFWVVYLSALIYHFSWRFPHTAWGVLGWWVMDIWYLYPILLVPYLHTLNRRRWAD